MPDPPAVEAAATDLSNQSKTGRMEYAPLVESQVPIGSRVTEAACKVLVNNETGDWAHGSDEPDPPVSVLS